MQQFRKKPVVIEAAQFISNEDRDITNGQLLAAWCGGTFCQDALGYCILIDTPEGTMRADPSDWIIKGIANEFYPCKPEIFAATYEAV